MTSPQNRTRGGESAPSGCADVMLGLLLFALDAGIALLIAFGLAMRGWGRQLDLGSSGRPPAMDWAPTLWLGGLTLAVTLVAVALARGKWPWAAGFQFLAAAFLCVVTLLATHTEWEHTHPEPAPGRPPAPSVGCRSGGDNSECADIGG
ncbi:DUF6234 family protein [Streptomyces sp. SP18CS02]|uniref:DUF6234 family protein n=1 Tax=Streptomyces sp. SP18CS02 TaxID=3002531 RepID=UPI002E765F71|nr:DUF6234 family protein [Streptomyces sp. SP18CS02]MEE1756068.1 DUF6234 family protein [Streptomyces sp. SP18CS02]